MAYPLIPARLREGSDVARSAIEHEYATGLRGNSLLKLEEILRILRPLAARIKNASLRERTRLGVQLVQNSAVGNVVVTVDDHVLRRCKGRCAKPYQRDRQSKNCVHFFHFILSPANLHDDANAFVRPAPNSQLSASLRR